MEEILKKLQDSIYDGDKVESEKLAQQALSSGIETLKVIEGGMKPGLARVGDAYESGELFLPELVGAGDAALAKKETAKNDDIHIERLNELAEAVHDSSVL